MTQEITGSDGSGELLAQDEWVTASGHPRNSFDKNDPAPQAAGKTPRVDGPPEQSSADDSAQIVPPQASNGLIAPFEPVQEWIARSIGLDLQEPMDIGAAELDRDTLPKSESSTQSLYDYTLDASGTLAAEYLDWLAPLGIEHLLKVKFHDLAERLAREWGPGTGHMSYTRKLVMR